MYAVSLTPSINMKSNNTQGSFSCKLECKSAKKEIHGSLNFTTSARTELAAIAEGIAALKAPCTVKVHTKSAYILKAIESDSPEWWENHGWKGRSGQEIKNVDLWLKILEAKRKHGHLISVEH